MLGDQRGFTLIELGVSMVVIIVILTVVGIGVSSIARADLKKTSGMMAASMRYLYNLAVINNSTYRLVIDMDTGEYWGEVMTSTDPCDRYLAITEEEQADEAERRERELEEQGLSSDEIEEMTEADGGELGGKFGRVKDNLLSKRKLPKNVIVTGVITTHHQRSQTEGRASIHFFPGGSAERAFIWLGEAPDDEDEFAVAEYTVELTAGLGQVNKYTQPLDETAFFRQVGRR